MGCGVNAQESIDNVPPVMVKISSKTNKPDGKPCFGISYSGAELAYNVAPPCEETKLGIQVWNENIENLPTVIESLERHYAESPETFLRNLQQGPPPEYRWEAWKVALNVNEICTPGTFRNLLGVEHKADARTRKLLDATVGATFTKFFTATQREGHELMVRELRNVILSASIFCPDMEYTPEMNSVVAFMLLVSNMKEEEVFWVLIALLKDSLTHDPMRMCGAHSLYTKQAGGLSELKMRFHYSFVNTLPDLKLYFESINFPESLWLQKWVLELFVNSFPFGYCLRFWDYIFSYGFSATLRLALAILVSAKRAFTGKDYGKCSEILNSFARGENLPSADELIEIASKLEPSKRTSSIKKYSKETTGCKKPKDLSSIIIKIEREPEADNFA